MPGTRKVRSAPVRNRSAKKSHSRAAAPAIVLKDQKKKEDKKLMPKIKLSTPMRTLVDRRVDKHLETKELRYMLWTPTSGAGSSAYTLRNEISNLSIKPLLCPITQSDDPQGNSPFRLGNTIHPVSLQVRVKLYIKADEDPQGTGAADRGAIQPYLFVGHNKNIKNIVNLTADNYGATIPYVWRTSQSTPSTQEAPQDQGVVTNFNGIRGDFIVGRLNTTLLRPIKGGVKTPVMTRDVGFYQNPVPTEGGGGFATRHVERNYIFNVPCPQKLKFSANDDEFPDNFAPFLMCGFTYVGGADPSIQAPLRIETNVTFRYKDA